MAPLLKSDVLLYSSRRQVDTFKETMRNDNLRPAPYGWRSAKLNTPFVELAFVAGPGLVDDQYGIIVTNVNTGLIHVKQACNLQAAEYIADAYFRGKRCCTVTFLTHYHERVFAMLGKGEPYKATLEEFPAVEAFKTTLDKVYPQVAYVEVKSEPNQAIAVTALREVQRRMRKAQRRGEASASEISVGLSIIDKYLKELRS